MGVGWGWRAGRFQKQPRPPLPPGTASSAKPTSCSLLIPCLARSCWKRKIGSTRRSQRGPARGTAHSRPSPPSFFLSLLPPSPPPPTLSLLLPSASSHPLSPSSSPLPPPTLSLPTPGDSDPPRAVDDGHSGVKACSPQLLLGYQTGPRVPIRRRARRPEKEEKSPGLRGGGVARPLLPFLCKRIYLPPHTGGAAGPFPVKPCSPALR